MKSFVVYNSEGQILRYGECPDGDLALQAGEGQSVLEAVFEPNKKVQDGALVDDMPTESELNARALKLLRTQRSQFLAYSDWTQVPDSPLSSEQRSEWQMYRQQLRDLPNDYATITSLEQVNFPTAPS
jgi:hypothetical protein